MPRFITETRGATRLLLLCCAAALACPPGPAFAQAAAAQTAAVPDSGDTSAFNTQQLDALLAPVALYPDTLLTQTLMAAAYPLQIVEAARWLNDPAHKSLKGDDLVNALKSQSWDPSVKATVAVPQVLEMMNGKLDWTQQVGYAFVNQQSDVMASVQRLRRQAQGAKQLQSTPQQVVKTEQQTIIIEPAQPDVIYVPSYNPEVVYGAWPYPAYPPVYMPPPPGYAVATGLAAGLAFGAGLAITASLWDIGRPNWYGGNVNVNVNRYNNINVNHTRINGNNWHPGYNNGGPHGGGFDNHRPPNGPAGHPARANGLPSNAIGRQNAHVPGNLVNKPNRPNGQSPAIGNDKRPGGDHAGGFGNRPGADGGGIQHERAGGDGGFGGGDRGRRGGGAFSGMGDGGRAGGFGSRGGESRRQSFGGGHAGGGQHFGGGRHR